MKKRSLVQTGLARRQAQKGIFLPILFIVIGILVLMAMQRLFFSRQSLNVTVRLANQEILYNVSKSALEISKAKLDSFFNACSKGDPDLLNNDSYKFFTNNFLDSQGYLDIKECSFPIENSNFEDLVESTDKNIDVNVSLELNEIEPLSGSLGTEPSIKDKYEKTFVLKLVSKASLDVYSVSSVCFTQGKLISLHVPPFSKFSIFLKRKGGFRVNEIFDSNESSSVDALPIQIINGSTLSNGDKLSPQEMSSFIENQGYIFLGGSDWNFGLTSCGNNKNLAAAGLDKEIYRFPVDKGPKSGTSDFKFYSGAKAMNRECRFTKMDRYLSKAPKKDTSDSALINLYGTENEPSPTLVIGNVKRKFILQQGIFLGKEAPLPYLESTGFHSRQWPKTPSNVVDFFYDQVFGGDYSFYAEKMSKPITDEYNRGILSYINNLNQADNLIFTSPNPQLPACSNIKINNVPILSSQWQLTKYLTLVDDNNQELFNGDPETFDADNYLMRKVCYIHESENDFFQARKNNYKLQIMGVERIKGPLNIKKPFTLFQNNAGIIIADGNILIKSKITSPGGFLYLVSRNGNISIETTQPVNAYLIALNGTIFMPEKFSILGGIAAAEFKSGSIKKSKRKMTISYNKELDITKSSIRKKGYRIFLNDDWNFYVR